MNNAQNGARIKVFGGSPYPNSTSGGGTGHVQVRPPLPLSECHAHRFQNVTFQDFYVNNVNYPIYLNQVRLPQIVRAPLTDIYSQCYFTPANVCAEYPSTVTISDVHCTFSTCAPRFAHPHLARHQRHRHVIRRGGRRRRRTRMLSRVLQHHRNRHQSDESPRSGGVLLSKRRQRGGARLSVYGASCIDSKHKGELIVGR